MWNADLKAMMLRVADCDKMQARRPQNLMGRTKFGYDVDLLFGDVVECWEVRESKDGVLACRKTGERETKKDVG